MRAGWRWGVLWGGLLIAGIAGAEPVSDEVDVWGESEIERARQEVVEALRGLGFDRKIVEKRGRLILKHRDPWRGQIVLYADGYIDHRRQGLLVQDPAQGSMGAAGWLLCPIQPTACVRAGGLTVSGRKLDRQRRETARVVEPKTRALRDRIADASTARTVNALPDRLDALWERGEPLVGEELLPDLPARRAHLLAFWASRTDTEWGEAVREALEAFAQAVIQPSADPFTADELAEAHRRTGRPFLRGEPPEGDARGEPF